MASDAPSWARECNGSLNAAACEQVLGPPHQQVVVQVCGGHEDLTGRAHGCDHLHPHAVRDDI
ncbi:hypothetical protein [Streptomyces sp. NPDC058424]|uniref:hypothetical protein n=1 Tax=Streptomyces sp. NPDC058424 TaxID=3346491 RepID=UPI0036637AEC